jgi:hypothetical protein
MFIAGFHDPRKRLTPGLMLCAEMARQGRYETFNYRDNGIEEEFFIRIYVYP